MKRVFKVIGIVVLVLVLAVGGLLGWLTATEFNPPAVEPAQELRRTPGCFLRGNPSPS